MTIRSLIKVSVAALVKIFTFSEVDDFKVSIIDLVGSLHPETLMTPPVDH